MDQRETSPVIYFDGECNLCSGSVQFILKRESKEQFRFASLQGESGQAFLKKHSYPVDHFDSFILDEDGKIFTRSTAALRVSRNLNFPWPLLYIFIVVPRFIRDGIYEYVSHHRYKWFGKKESCWIPDPKWKKRFLP